MLNYVWLSLLALGILIAVGTDVSDKVNNKFKNGESVIAEFVLDKSFNPNNTKSYNVTFKIYKEKFTNFFDEDVSINVIHKAKFNYDSTSKSALIYFNTDNNSPKIFKTMASAVGKENDLSATAIEIKRTNEGNYSAKVSFEEISFVKMKDVTNAALDYSKIAVNIALGLIGIMALWLGVMKVAEEAGLINIIAKIVRPITKVLFPEIPQDHPAIGAIIMNISANMLGLGNAATPFGLKAMEELDKLNTNKGTATNAMCTFLAVNTAGLTLIPATAIAVRSSAGSADPAIIIGTSIFGALCATLVGVTSAKLFESFSSGNNNWFKENYKKIGILFFITLAIIIGFLSGLFSSLSFISADTFKAIIQVVSILAIPTIIITFITYGAIKKVKVYEVFVEGAKEGFNVAVKIIPYLVAMLVAIGIFRAGGAMDFLTLILNPITNLIGLPAEALPMALMRPLSGSGSLGIMTEIMANHGPDSFIGILTSTMFGSTETTFYVIAVYFGSVNIRKTRHALPAGLLADAAGLLGALFIVKLLFG